MLSWALFYLAKYPEVQERLHEEIVHKIGGAEVDHMNIGELVYVSLYHRDVLHKKMA